jgi:XTP/dITP diphosphohydrolase
MTKLLLGTSNPGKLRELSVLLRDLHVTLVHPKQLDLDMTVPETGKSYAENASLKARAYAQCADMWALADDTGLEVQALGGRPGLRSARIVGPGGEDSDRRAALLKELAGLPRPWRAAFVCLVALAGPDGELSLARGECLGEIVPQARGAGGFGYDPLFLVDDVGRTMAELTMAEKNLTSHRARAFAALKPTLLERLALRPS